jgi:hypothetical protein
MENVEELTPPVPKKLIENLEAGIENFVKTSCEVMVQSNGQDYRFVFVEEGLAGN